MNIAGHDIGLCSWSVHPRDMAELVSILRQLKLDHVQLAIADLAQLDKSRQTAEIDQLRSAGIVITAGMLAFPGEDYSTIQSIRRTGGFMPDDRWPERRKLASLSAKFAAEIGVKMIGTHVGFVPHSESAGYAEARDRVRAIAADFAGVGIDLVMETGQESAADLLEFLKNLNANNVFVNFDPANMVLYGAGDPIEAVGILGHYIRHVHVKDAKASVEPGEAWGEEVPFGTGQVGSGDFLKALDAIGYGGPLVIEREAGNDRVGDVQIAIESIRHAAK
jgi:L-ribulose-5-phosphate 3-epimerase